MLSVFFVSCVHAQKGSYHKENVSVIRNTSDTSGSDVLLLIFETDFNDTAEIYVGKERVYTGILKTNKRLQAVPTVIRLSPGEKRDETNISVFLKNQLVFVEFPYLQGYEYVFVTRWKRTWYVEYTNYMKDLR